MPGLEDLYREIISITTATRVPWRVAAARAPCSGAQPPRGDAEAPSLVVENGVVSDVKVGGHAISPRAPPA